MAPTNTKNVQKVIGGGGKRMKTVEEKIKTKKEIFQDLKEEMQENFKEEIEGNGPNFMETMEFHRDSVDAAVTRLIEAGFELTDPRLKYMCTLRAVSQDVIDTTRFVQAQKCAVVDQHIKCVMGLIYECEDYMKVVELGFTAERLFAVVSGKCHARKCGPRPDQTTFVALGRLLNAFKDLAKATHDAFDCDDETGEIVVTLGDDGKPHKIGMDAFPHFTPGDAAAYFEANEKAFDDEAKRFNDAHDPAECDHCDEIEDEEDEEEEDEKEDD